MAHAICIERTGGPEVLQWREVAVADPGPGQVRIVQRAVGINYIDIYHRSGVYPLSLPSGIGMEAAGEVVAVGPGVETCKVGDRVAYASAPLGAYATERLMPADRLVGLPSDLGDEQAAAVLLQGLTAHYLLHRTYRVSPGETILVHAAAGGVGLILCQWAQALGATVIGTVSTDAKAELARAHGCAHTIIYGRESFPERVRELTDGEGVPVVYDSVGRDTFEGSLSCLRPLGMMVSFGNASGVVPPIDAGKLSRMGSLFFTRPGLAHYVARREDLLAGASALFDVVRKGTVRVEIRQRYPLQDAARAHRDLEARATTGSSVLLP